MHLIFFLGLNPNHDIVKFTVLSSLHLECEVIDVLHLEELAQDKLADNDFVEATGIGVSDLNGNEI